MKCSEKIGAYWIGHGYQRYTSFRASQLAGWMDMDEIVRKRDAKLAAAKK